MSTSLQTQLNSSIIQEESLIDEQDILVPLRKEDVLVPGVADKHPRDMPEMAFVIAFCIQYNEAVGNLDFLPEELEDAIVRREPLDLVERIHRYFLRNAMNIQKIIDKRYWIRKLNQHLNERIDRKEFSFSYNPLDRVGNVYHELSNFEKVTILKDLVIWQFRGSEKIQTMWQFKESERIQSLSDLKAENLVRPVEVEVLGTDNKGSTYFYLGVGARVYREIPSANGAQQCTWEALTTTLQDLKDLINDRVEIDPDRSEKECLLHKRISKELIPDIESRIEEERAAEEAAIDEKSGERIARDNQPVVQYNRDNSEVPDSSVAECENVQSGIEDSVGEPNAESILSVSMWSVTRPSKNLQTDSNQEVNSSSVAADSNDINTSTSTAAQCDDDNVDTANNKKDQLIDQSSFAERQNIETGILKNVTGNKRRMEEQTSGDDDSSDFGECVKRIKFGKGDDDVMIFESDITERSRQEKGKEVLRNEPYDNPGPHNVNINKLIDSASIFTPKIDKGKSVLRHGEPNQIVEGGYVNRGCNSTNVSQLSKEIDREVFRPGPEELDRLEWSLNHMFFEELEIFGEDSDSELSDCCDDCITEVDHLLVH